MDTEWMGPPTAVFGRNSRWGHRGCLAAAGINLHTSNPGGSAEVGG